MSIYAIKDCANLTLFTKDTGAPFLYTDYANVATNEWTSDRVFATAKGTNAIAFDANKQSTLVVEMEVFDLQWLAVVAGSDLKSGEQNIAKREVVYIDATKKATLSGSPVAGSVAVLKLEADLITHSGDPLTSTASTSVTTGQFNATGSQLTFATDAVVGDAYAVYYLVKDTTVKTLEIAADKFPKAFKVIADAMIRERETGRDEFVQIEYPNARPQSNFSIAMSATDPATLSVTFDLFPDAKKRMATYKFLGE